MIFYFCPDMEIRSGGIHRLYRHVRILVEHGFEASILHSRQGFRAPGMPDVPVASWESGPALSAGDVIVIPEAAANLMEALRDKPLRRIVCALSWSYIFPHLRRGQDWRDHGIERVLTVSPFVRDSIAWSMGLPVELLDFAVDPQLFAYRPEEKQPRIVYFKRKARRVHALRRVLGARDPRMAKQIEWVGIDGLDHADYAAEVRKASVFLTLSTEEALNLSVWEAMSAGAVVAGYHGIGMRDVLQGDGPQQNAILADGGDYITLARRMEPMLQDLLAGQTTRWHPLIKNARELAAPHTPQSEEQSVVACWRRLMASPAAGAMPGR